MADIKYEFVARDQDDVSAAFNHKPSALVRALAWLLRPLVAAFWHASDRCSPTVLTVKSGDVLACREGMVDIWRLAKELKDAAASTASVNPTSVK